MGFFEANAGLFFVTVVLVAGAAGWIGGKLGSTRPADFADSWWQRLISRV